MNSGCIQFTLVVVAAVWCAPEAAATDLTLHLSGGAGLSTKVVQYQCDAQGTAIGLPSGSFWVAYVNGAGNSLVIVPLNGFSLVFANVTFGSGARYAANIFGGNHPVQSPSTPMRSQEKSIPLVTKL